MNEGKGTHWRMQRRVCACLRRERAACVSEAQTSGSGAGKGWRRIAIGVVKVLQPERLLWRLQCKRLSEQSSCGCADVLWCLYTCAAAWQLLSVQRSLTAYYDRFKGVLNPVNAQNIQCMQHIASTLHNCLQQPQEPAQQQSGGMLSSSSSSRVMAVNDLLFDLGLDHINMFELAHWVKENKMAYKVGGRLVAGGSLVPKGGRR